MFYRYDLNVRSLIGQVVDGASVAVLTQPATFPNGENQPGTPLAQIYAASSSNSANVTAASWQQGVLTYTFDAVPADVVPGSYFSVDGANPSTFDGAALDVYAVDMVAGTVQVLAQTSPGTWVSGGTVATSVLPNPLDVDNLGNAFFYATPDLYTVQIFDSEYRITPLVLDDQAIESPGGGSVTSVALTMPGIFAVAGSPLTSSGTLAVTFNTQTANQVLAGPVSGSPAAPAFRNLVAADIPSLSYAASVGLSVTVPGYMSGSVAGSPVTSSGTLALTLGFGNQSANVVFAGPASGSVGAPSFRALVPADIPAGLQNVTVTLTAAQLLALNATPVQLIPAPGAGFAVIPVYASMQYKFVTAGYGNAADYNLCIGPAAATDTQCAIIQPTAGFLDQTSSQIAIAASETTAPQSLYENAAIDVLLLSSSGALTGGGGSLTINLTYFVAPLM